MHGYAAEVTAPTIPNAAVKLTPKPLDAAQYTDRRMVWGEKRCYVIVAAQTIGGATIESVAPPPVCAVG